MKWRDHNLDSDTSLVKDLNKRLGDLKKIHKKSPFKSRKLIASGIFMSDVFNTTLAVRL